MQGTGQRDRKDVRCRTRDGAIARTRRRAGAGEARASWKTAGTSASGIFATHTHESRSSRSTLSSCSVAMCVSSAESRCTIARSASPAVGLDGRRSRVG